MDVKSIQDEKLWDDFVKVQPDYTFLDSWAWGSFNEALGSKVWRLGMFDGDTLEGAALVIFVAARRGRFLFVPHGPIFNFQSSVAYAPSSAPPLRAVAFSIFNKFSVSNFQTFIDYLKRFAREERCAFIRISPLLLKTPENEKVFLNLGFRKAPIHMHAETTWLLDTTLSEEELLAGMRKTTRYLVRRGDKEGVEVASGNDIHLLREFYNLYDRTAARQRFVPFSFDYIVKEAAAFGEDGARVYLAKQGGKALAGALVVFHGDRAFYHHGASLHHPTASYLLQWRIIQEAKARGVKEYNFWGVDFRPGHPWAGVTLFKTGFGGSMREYVPAHDLPIRFSYWISFAIETLRRMRRRY